jgi:hypothetical protein
MTSAHARTLGVVVTIAVALALVGYYSTWLLWEDIRPWRVYKVRFAKTGGLRKKDEVFSYGLLVGRVHDVRLDGDQQLVELQVEPEVSIHRSGADVSIESVNAFGDVAVFIDPGDPKSATFGPDDRIVGNFHEGFTAPEDDTGGTTRLSEMIHDFQDVTNEVARSDTGLFGRLLNDPDFALGLRDGFSNLHETTLNLRETVRELETSEEGPSAVLSPDVAASVVDAVGRVRGALEPIQDGLRGAAEGEPGLAGRLLGDPSVRDASRDAVTTLSVVLERYRTSDTDTGSAIFSHAPGPGDRFTESLETLARESSEASRGEGDLGPLLGAGTGPAAREIIANLGRTLENARTADPSSGAIFSSSPQGRREFEDVVSRAEETLRGMRSALMRIRADQAPNNFPGALFSVF